VAAVTVTDTAAPTLSSAAIFPGALNQIVLNFSEPVSAASALNAANYTVTNAAGAAFTIISAQFLNGDPRTVVLTTSGSMAGANYGVRVTGVQDLNGNTIATVTRTFAQNGAPTAAGGLAQFTGPIVTEYYGSLANFGGIQDLVNNPKFQLPDFINYSNAFGIHPNNANFPNQGFGDNYGVRMYTYFVPPSSGTFKFYLRADDFAEFIMNTNNNPALSTLPMDAIFGVTGSN